MTTESMAPEPRDHDAATSADLISTAIEQQHRKRSMTPDEWIGDHRERMRDLFGGDAAT